MPVNKRKLVPPHMLSPTQFMVHEDIVNEKVDEILAGGTPHAEARMYRSGRLLVEQGHHTAAAYEALGRPVPVHYQTGYIEEEGEPDYEWEDMVHVSEGNLKVDHPLIGPMEWEHMKR